MEGRNTTSRDKYTMKKCITPWKLVCEDFLGVTKQTNQQVSIEEVSITQSKELINGLTVYL